MVKDCSKEVMSMFFRARILKTVALVARLFLLLAVSQAAAAQPLPAERHVGRLDIHFGTVDRNSFPVRDTIAALQSAYEDYRRLFGLSRPIQVYLLSAWEFGRVCPLYISNCDRISGLTVGGIIYINVERANSWLARHELFHTVWSTTDPRYRWLSEGLAVWFEDVPDYGWQDGASPAQVAARAMGVRLVGVDVYRWNQASANLSAYYEQANLRVEFLANLYGKERIFRLVNLLRGGMDVPTAFRAAFGFPIERLDQVMVAFVTPQVA